MDDNPYSTGHEKKDIQTAQTYTALLTAASQEDDTILDVLLKSMDCEKFLREYLDCTIRQFRLMEEHPEMLSNAADALEGKSVEEITQEAGRGLAIAEGLI